LASKALLAKILVGEHRYAEAEQTAQQAFDVQLRVLGAQHIDTLNSMQILGTAMVYNHRYDEAKKLFGDVLEKADKTQEATVPLGWYKFACVAAAAHDPDEAVQLLREAVNHGYKDIDRIRTDDDLKSLRGNPRFETFLTDVRKRTEASSQQHN
jgi:eukaryotic-like serine/threonine-protein kinase